MINLLLFLCNSTSKVLFECGNLQRILIFFFFFSHRTSNWSFSDSATYRNKKLCFIQVWAFLKCKNRITSSSWDNSSPFLGIFLINSWWVIPDGEFIAWINKWIPGGEQVLAQHCWAERTTGIWWSQNPTLVWDGRHLKNHRFPTCCRGQGYLWYLRMCWKHFWGCPCCWCLSPPSPPLLLCPQHTCLLKFSLAMWKQQEKTIQACSWASPALCEQPPRGKKPRRERALSRLGLQRRGKG